MRLCATTYTVRLTFTISSTSSSTSQSDQKSFYKFKIDIERGLFSIQHTHTPCTKHLYT